jgi:NTP pyrophosphatase (non-canonical NTP hydrolase)
MSLKRIEREILKFRDQRDWAQFHTHKDVALSLLIEASEYAQLIQFKSPKQIEQIKRTELSHELADVLYWLVLAAQQHGINLEKAFAAKMRINRRKYPIKKFKGSNKKYR